MRAYVVGGLVCLGIWGILVYGAGIGAGSVHALAALGFLLVARGLITARAT